MAFRYCDSGRFACSFVSGGRNSVLVCPISVRGYGTYGQIRWRGLLHDFLTSRREASYFVSGQPYEMSSPKDSIGAPRSCRRTRASVSTTSTADDISTPPTKTEIRYWKNLLYQERRGATQHYFMYGTPMNARHEKWLREKERKERKERHEKAVKIKEQTSTTTARESKLKAQTPEPTVVESTDSDSETVESSTAQSEDSQATTVVPIAKPVSLRFL